MEVSSINSRTKKRKGFGYEAIFNKIEINKYSFLYLVVIFFAITAFILILPKNILAATIIDASTTTDNTWNLAGSPYIVMGTHSIETGVTLTIEPGVVVKFAGSEGKYLNVSGTLNAKGTVENPIYFTEYKDDTVGGDSNGDGTGSTPSAGAWDGISIEGTGSAVLEDCIIRYGGGDAKLYTCGNIYKSGSGNLIMSGCTISNSASNGINIHLSTGSNAISNCSITDNSNYGILIKDIGTDFFTGEGNTFTFNKAGNVVIEAGTLTRSMTLSSAYGPYIITGSIQVGDGSTLTIDPGAVIKFASYTTTRSDFVISGTLNAKGTAKNPIYFTFYSDDTVGGDSNGDGTGSTPSAGAWGSIIINDTGSAALENCTIKYGGTSNFQNYGNIFKRGSGNLTMTNCTVSNSSSYGIQIRNSTSTDNITNCIIYNNRQYGIMLLGSNPNIFNNKIYSNYSGGMLCIDNANPIIGGSTDKANLIYQNSYYGVQNYDSPVNVNARYNWWGDATGPYHTTSNPSGKGNRVSDYVNYSNYLTEAPTTDSLTITSPTANSTLTSATQTITAEATGITLDHIYVTVTDSNGNVANVGTQNGNSFSDEYAFPAPGTYTINAAGRTTVDDSDPNSQVIYADPVTVTVVQGLAITTTDLPTGTEGSPYNAALTASGGTPPYTWSTTGLPAGLSIDTSTGVISGTPTQTGTFTVGLTVSDNAGGQATASLGLTINQATVDDIQLTGAGFEIADGGSIELGQTISLSGNITTNTSLAVVDIEIQGPDDGALGGTFFRKEDFAADTKSFDLSQVGNITTGPSENIINKPGTYWLYLYAKTPNMQDGILLQKKTITLMPTLPMAKTEAATNIDQTTATLNGVVTQDGGEPVTEYGFWYCVYGTGNYMPVNTTGSINTNTPYSMTVTGLSPGVKYSYYAYAKNSVGESTPVTSEYFTTIPDKTPPSMINSDPYNGKYVGTTEKINVKFNENTIIRDKTLIQVYNTSNNKMVANLESAITDDMVTLVISHINGATWSNLTKYQVRIKIGAIQDESLNYNTSEMSFYFTVADKPTGLVATPVSASEIDLSWNASAGATSYYIFRSTIDGNYQNIANVKAPATSYKDTGLEEVIYYYKIQAASKTCLSEYSTPVLIETKAPPLSIIDVTPLTNSTDNGSETFITFRILSEIRDYNTSGFLISKYPDRSYPIPVEVEVNTANGIIIKPLVDLDYNTMYYVTFKPGSITDNEGCTLEENYDFYFKTRDTGIPNGEKISMFLPENDYNQGLAYFLAQISHEAYMFGSPTLEKYDFTDIQNYETLGLDALIGKKQIRLYQNGNLETKNIYIIAFRGTETGWDGKDFNIDWYKNFYFNPIPYELLSNEKGNVHEGFYNMEEDFRCWAAKYENQINPNDVFIITGHSQGGALASLYTTGLYERGLDSSNVICYTFAAPPIGDKTFYNYFDSKMSYIKRIENVNDIVTAAGTTYTDFSYSIGTRYEFTPTGKEFLAEYKKLSGEKYPPLPKKYTDISGITDRILAAHSLYSYKAAIATNIVYINNNDAPTN